MKKTINLMPCLDMRDGRVVKGIHFADMIYVGDPVEFAVAYEASGADGVGFLDIAATVEQRPATFDVLRRVAAAVKIPVTAGGGDPDAGRCGSGLGRRGEAGRHLFGGGARS